MAVIFRAEQLFAADIESVTKQISTLLQESTRYSNVSAHRDRREYDAKLRTYGVLPSTSIHIVCRSTDQDTAVAVTIISPPWAVIDAFGLYRRYSERFFTLLSNSLVIYPGQTTYASYNAVSIRWAVSLLLLSIIGLVLLFARIVSFRIALVQYMMSLFLTILVLMSVTAVLQHRRKFKNTVG